MISAIKASIALERELFDSTADMFKFNKSLPFLSIPSGYSICPIFAFNGAAVRFLVRKDGNPDKCISVYLDVKGVLGNPGGRPYWEAYEIDDTNKRYTVGESPEMIADIIAELDK